MMLDMNPRFQVHKCTNIIRVPKNVHVLEKISKKRKAISHDQTKTTKKARKLHRDIVRN